VQKVITSKKNFHVHNDTHTCFSWRDFTVFEHEVSPLQRFLADVPLSSGAWVCVPPALHASSPDLCINTPAKDRASSNAQQQQQPQQWQQSGCSTTGYRVVDADDKISTCHIEVKVPWRSIVCLTPDATQLADHSWDPFSSNIRGGGGGGGPQYGSPPASARHAAATARRGEVSPLKLLVLDVCLATKDGVQRTPVATHEDPIVVISCVIVHAGNQEMGAKPCGRERGLQEESDAFVVVGEHGEAIDPGGIIYIQ